MKRFSMSNRFAVAFAVLALCTLVYAAKKWEKEPFTEWSKETAFKVLTDSPWAKQQKFRTETALLTPSSGPIYAPREGSGGHSEGSRPDLSPTPSAAGRETYTTAVFNINFLSARPIRMALARLAMLNGALDEKQAHQFVDQAATNQVAIAISVPGNQQESFMMDLETAQLLDSTYLELKKSKRKIYLEQYYKPGEAGNEQALFLFPRTKDGEELFTLEEKEVKFVCQLGPRMRLERKFKFKDMVFDGKLEI